MSGGRPLDAPAGGAFGDAAERERFLRSLAAAGDTPIALAEAALALAAFDRPGVDLARYHHHLSLIRRDVAAAAHAAESVTDRVAALNAVILESYRYEGDALTYDDVQNANLMRVIDRRKGLPVALGILYIDAARAQGWTMCGLGFPGHFLVRLDVDGDRVILDPFNGGAVRDASALRDLLKAMSGSDAELTAQHYAPVSDRAVLLRLQNNIKLRLVQSRQLAQALRIIDGMLLFMPDAPSLWREAALLNARLGNYRAAIAAIETFLEREPGSTARHEGAMLLQQFRAKLN